MTTMSVSVPPIGAFIRIVDSRNDSNEVRFPIPDDGRITLLDLQGAFPDAVCLRYREKDSCDVNHVLCRNDVFLEPHEGWVKDGRVYLAVTESPSKVQARTSLFDSYRRQVAKQRDLSTNRLTSSQRERSEPKETMVTVGIGTWKRGKFTKIAANTSFGGTVIVGPLQKTGNTHRQIRDLAFKKFSIMFRNFRRKFSNKEAFKLVYGDGTPVDKLPDGFTDFSIAGYRDFIDHKMRFDRLRFYLCEDDTVDVPEITICTDESSEEELLPFYPEMHSTNLENETLSSVSKNSTTEANSYQDSSEGPDASTSQSKQNVVSCNRVRSDSTDGAIPPPILRTSRLSRRRNRVPANESSDDTLAVNGTVPTDATYQTQLLTVEVIFRMEDDIVFSEIFPNNSTFGTLQEYIMHCSGLFNTEIVEIFFNDEIIAPEDRVSMYSQPGIPLELSVRLNCSREEKEGHYNEIPGVFEITSTEVVDAIIERTLIEAGNKSDPRMILQIFSKNFNRGRPLDITAIDECPTGQTSPIFISRNETMTTATSEILALQNLRYPLEVNFYGEMAQDFGGPRKEFFRLALGEILNILFDVGEGEVIDARPPDPNLLLNRTYYVAGIVIGLSLLQGGPPARFLDGILDTDEEHYDQLRVGLQRVGMIQMLKAKPSLRLLFRPSTETLSVGRLLNMLAPAMDEPGSNRRRMEEAAYRTFVLYVREVAAGRRGYMTLGRLLAFVTGSEEEPLMGFAMPPSLKFSDGRLPTSSTCINELRIPLNAKVEDFELFDLSFMNDYFGQN